MVSSHDALITIIFALALGIFLVILAHHFRISMIVPLLIGGVLVGPHFLGLIDPKGIGSGLKTIISLAIAVILFEGGMSLQLSGLKQAPKVIKRLLSVGVIFTWFAISSIVYLLFDLNVSMSLLAGSLVVVTGPTVVQPLIRRIGLNERLQHILSWEAILIDPIGVFIALLCFEWVNISSYESITHYFGIAVPAKFGPFIAFFIRSFIGIIAGILGGIALDKILRKNIIPHEILNMTVLSFALLIFGICELVEHETGILAVTVAGFWLALKDPPHLKQIRKFKLELTDMAIGVLFVLLAANLNIDNFLKLGVPGIFAILLVVFVVRPISVLLSTIGTDLKRSEKMFLGWMAPRGIVAASMAAIVTIYLHERNIPNTEFFESFTYAIIGTTVLLQGLLSSQVASFLNVKSPDRNGWLIVGINTFSIEIARFIRRLGITVTLIDTNAYNVANAKEKGYDAVHGDALNVTELDLKYFARVGNVLALTDNKDLNVRICFTWHEFISKSHLYRWQPNYLDGSNQETIGNVVFSDLPKPSNVSNELDNEYSRIVLKTIEPSNTDEESKGSVTPILNFANNTFTFSGENNKTLSKGINLLLERNDFYLARVIQEHLITSLNPKSFDEMLELLMQRISNVIPIIPYERTLADLVARESKSPTLIGNGVAIPHVYCPELTKSICMIARLEKPIPIEEKDGVPISIAFFLLSPPENPKMHLRILSDIAKLVSDKNNLAAITVAKNKTEILKVLHNVTSNQEHEAIT
mgnify:CR=1 FL=1